MKTAILYESWHHGNTRKLCEAIKWVVTAFSIIVSFTFMLAFTMFVNFIIGRKLKGIDMVGHRRALSEIKKKTIIKQFALINYLDR